MGKAGFLALIALGFLAFFNAIGHPFVHDDVIFILNNPHINHLNHWTQAFKVTAVSDGINTYYRPVLEIISRIEYHFFGPHPFGFHLINVLVHIINGLLLFSLLQKLGLTKRTAWVIALLFLIHPVQTEAVACISGISNLWMALGVLLALHAYLNQWYTASFLLFTVAFLSKEQALLFVPLVIVIDYARGFKNFRSWLFWVLTAIVLCWLRQSVTHVSLFNEIMTAPKEVLLRLAAIPRDIGIDLRLILCPYDLHYYRSTDILQSNSLSWALAFVFILGFFYILKGWPQGRSTMILGFGWFLAALLPVLNIAPLINEYSFILTPEHFLYLPIVGILMVGVFAVDYFLKHFKVLILSIVVISCLLGTWHQNTFWRSEIALFERMLKFEPNFGRGHLLLAKAYYFNGKFQQANGHYEKAYLIMTGYAKKATNLKAQRFYLKYIKEILFDWAQNDCSLGQWESALDKYKQEAGIDNQDATIYNNMAFVYLHMGDKSDAYQSLEQALRIDPTFTQAKMNLQALGSV